MVIPTVPASEALHVVVDSTGVKVYAEGEWKTRQRSGALRAIATQISAFHPEHLDSIPVENWRKLRSGL